MKLNTKPLISIIIPVYNGEDVILRAVNSVLHQTYKNIEILVIDDKSTDNTLEILSTIKDKRLRIFKQKKNYQIGSIARNVGMRNAKGEYIAFLDDDDEFLPERIDKLYKEIVSKGDEYRAVTSSYFSKDGKTWKIVHKVEEEQSIKNLLLMRTSVGGCSIMIHKSILNDVGFFDESFRRHQDIEYTIRILRKTKFAVVNEPLVKIYGHPGAPNAQKILEVKEHFLNTFKEDIEKFDIKIQNEIYAKHWLQVSRFFALDADMKNTLKYFLKSLKYTLLYSDKLKIIPKETYFLLPIYLLKSIIFGKRKWKQ